MTHPAIPVLARQFLDRFPARARPWRTLGREAEYPVVHPDGTSADISVLWPHLADGLPHVWQREGDLIVGVELPGVTWSAEVGRGTIEAVLGPFDDLHAMQAAHEAAMRRLLRAAEREGLLVLGYGIQPVTPGTPDLMTPKERYRVLLDVLGETWLWFTLTASDQTHVAVSRDEVIPIANVTNLLAPMSIALLANSPIHDGRDHGVCSARESTMGTIHAGTYRHGMTPGPAADAADWISRSFPLEFFMKKEAGRIVPVREPFGDWLSRQDLDEDSTFTAWQYHDHYMWNSTRPRVAHGTVELRSPCQQPWPEHMAAAAWGAGVVCAWQEIAAFLDEQLGDDLWPAFRRWHHDAILIGLDAPEPKPGLIAGVLQRASDALAARGRGEEAFLAPLWSRLEKRCNPGQVARQAFNEGGIPALLDAVRIRL